MTTEPLRTPTDADFAALTARVAALENQSALNTSAIASAQATLVSHGNFIQNIQQNLQTAQTAVAAARADLVTVRTFLRNLVTRLQDGTLVNESGDVVADLQPALPPDTLATIDYLRLERAKLARR